VATRVFSLNGSTTNEEYRYGGQTELGTYAHTFEAHADLDTMPGSDGSNNPVISIS